MAFQHVGIFVMQDTLAKLWLTALLISYIHIGSEWGITPMGEQFGLCMPIFGKDINHNGKTFLVHTSLLVLCSMHYIKM